jgi:hypothetical protein
MMVPAMYLVHRAAGMDTMFVLSVTVRLIRHCLLLLPPFLLRLESFYGILYSIK